MKNYIHKSQFFAGNKISEYGLKRGFVDYGTLAKAFDAVLVNDITKLFYSEIGGEYNEVEQVNGIIDNQSEIDELKDEAEELEWQQCEMIKNDQENSPEYKAIEEKLQKILEKIEELEDEQDNPPEIYQYFIISNYGAELLQDCTDEIVYYLPCLDCYVWGVTHWGTSWDYVLTNIKIELDEA